MQNASSLDFNFLPIDTFATRITINGNKRFRKSELFLIIVNLMILESQYGIGLNVRFADIPLDSLAISTTFAMFISFIIHL